VHDTWSCNLCPWAEKAWNAAWILQHLGKFAKRSRLGICNKVCKLCAKHFLPPSWHIELHKSNIHSGDVDWSICRAWTAGSIIGPVFSLGSNLAKLKLSRTKCHSCKISKVLLQGQHQFYVRAICNDQLQWGCSQNEENDPSLKELELWEHLIGW